MGPKREAPIGPCRVLLGPGPWGLYCKTLQRALQGPEGHSSYLFSRIQGPELRLNLILEECELQGKDPTGALKALAANLKTCRALYHPPTIGSRNQVIQLIRYI